MHNILDMYCDIAHKNWAYLLPFVQVAHNAAFSSTIHETPQYLIFGRTPTFPIDIIMGMPQVEVPDTLQYTRETVEKVQLAYELARQNLGERSAAQEEYNVHLRVQQFQPGDLVLVHHYP